MRLPDGSALKLVSFSVNHMRVDDGSPLFGAFLDCLDVAAIEYLEGRATNLTGQTLPGITIGFEVDMIVEARHAWKVWLEDCGHAHLRPGIHWRADDDGDRGPVFDVITRRVRSTMEAAIARNPICEKCTVQIHADIAQVSAHQKLALIARRTALLDQYEHDAMQAG